MRALWNRDEEQILAWADVHFRRERRWPQRRSGRLPEAPEKTWLAIDKALKVGRRGLPGGTSLARLLRRHRNLLLLSYVPIRAAWARPQAEHESEQHGEHGETARQPVILPASSASD